LGLRGKAAGYGASNATLWADYRRLGGCSLDGVATGRWRWGVIQEFALFGECPSRGGGKIFCLYRFFHSDRNCWKEQIGLPDGLVAL
jgi:hypothetical protein